MRPAPRRALIGALALTLLLSVAVLVLAPGALAQSTTRVRVDDNLYAPQELTITEGDSVTWVWRGENPHSVTSPGGGFDSHPSCSPATTSSCGTQGSAYTIAFETPGQYDYVCRVHGAEMTGTITVEEAEEPSPEPSPSEPSPSEPSPSEPEPSEPSPPGPPGTELPTEPTPEPTPTPTPTPTQAEPSPSEPQPEPTPQAPPPEPSPTPSVTPPSRDPDPEPSEPDEEEIDLIPFPSPQTPTGSPEPGEVAIDVPDDGGGGLGRAIWLAVASLGVLGSAGAFGSAILFGQPWEA